jgi:hypothetical protein
MAENCAVSLIGAGEEDTDHIAPVPNQLLICVGSASMGTQSTGDMEDFGADRLAVGCKVFDGNT